MWRWLRRQRGSDHGESTVTVGDLLWPGRFIVQFDGRHQGAFDRESEAVAWAQHVAEHYEHRRWIYVTRNRFGRRRELVHVLPREDQERATSWWYEHMPGGDGSAAGDVGF